MTISLLTATAAASGLDVSGVLVLAVLVFLGWRLALIVLFPYGPHRPCRGTGKHRSGKYWRPCRGCKGTGRRIRLGRRIWNWTHGNEPTR